MINYNDENDVPHFLKSNHNVTLKFGLSFKLPHFDLGADDKVRPSDVTKTFPNEMLVEMPPCGMNF